MSRRVLLVAQPIVNKDGTMARQFQEWQSLVTKLLPILGTGDPEGAVKANQNQHYYDTSGAAGSVLYIKMVDDVAGDKSQGWRLA